MRGNGADAIVRTLADLGVKVCFANPGTSEMHLVSALDREPRIRPVLCLFEGVATGAADGFARIAGTPAMTLLHLGPGYANGAANLHNARRAFSPVVNVVGDHARGHAEFDAPLASDIAGIAATSSIWVRTVESPDGCAHASAVAFAASREGAGGPATLILPADCAWSDAPRPVPVIASKRVAAPGRHIADLAGRFRQARSPAILLGGHATRDGDMLALAGRLAAAGATVFADTFVARQHRGAGVFHPHRLRYFAEEAAADLAHHDLLVLVATTAPVSFFAYPGKPGRLTPASADIVELVGRDGDVLGTLVEFAAALDAPISREQARQVLPAIPEGALTPASIGQSLSRHMITDSIVSDDGVTSSGPIYAATEAAPRHDWLGLTGGAIGQGLPLAIGAAIARPTARVIALSGDGAAMYTVQSLWTMVREALDITIIVFANHAYRILDIEFARTGAGQPGRATEKLLGLGDPQLDWCALAKGMGMAAVSCSDAADFDRALSRSFAQPGPSLIEARIA